MLSEYESNSVSMKVIYVLSCFFSSYYLISPDYLQFLLCNTGKTSLWFYQTNSATLPADKFSFQVWKTFLMKNFHISYASLQRLIKIKELLSVKFISRVKLGILEDVGVAR